MDDLGKVVKVDNKGSVVSSWRRLNLFKLIDLILRLHSVKEGRERERERERESEGEMFDSPTVAGTRTPPKHHHRRNIT